jgi:predicted ATP-grasp superfamily ATP-dependent carboligase
VSGLALVLGLAHEPPVAAVVRELERLGQAYWIAHQPALIAGDCRTWFDGTKAGGAITVGSTRIPLEDVTGVYTRLASWADLPEIVADPDLLHHARHLHEAIDGWLEVTAARVINRTSANDTNNSKPYQAMIIREHFDIPATLISNDPETVEAFWRECGRVVYKSVSGERSIVTMLTDADIQRIHLLANAPVQFQEYVPGIDVRVHVVGSDVFATRVESDATDYRYDRSGGVRMNAVDVSNAVVSKCVALTARLGLELAGIDLRYADDGRIVCFEVNPSPAYTVYQNATGQPIATAIARRLSGA